MVLVPLNGSKLDVDFSFTSYGSSDTYFEPGDPAEIEIEFIMWEVGITIPKCLWETKLTDIMLVGYQPKDQYIWATTLYEWCEQWILEHENVMDYYDDYIDD